MLEPVEKHPMLVVSFVAVTLLASLGTTPLLAFDETAEEQVQVQPELQKKIRTDKLIMTKCRANEKTFCYLQFLKQEPEKPSCDVLPEETPASEGKSRERVWLTIQIGYVADEDERFTAADSLYTSTDGTAFADTVQQSEFEQYSDQLCQAITLTETRYEAKIRAAWLKLEQWLDDRAGPAPMVKEDDVTVLQELHNLKVHLFGDRNINPPCDEATPIPKNIADQENDD